MNLRVPAKLVTGLFLFALLSIGGIGVAQAACTLPYTITNGQPADASQVMANYNAIVTCLGATVAPGTAGQIGYYPSNGSSLSGTDLSSLLDASMGSTQGSILFRDATGWKLLPPGTGQQFLQTQGAGANPQWVDGTGGGDYAKAGSANLVSVSSFKITGLNTISYDYDVKVRCIRPTGGVSSDYLTIQFGDTSATPNWFTITTWISASGPASTYLTSTSGVANIAQVQNTTTNYMGVSLRLMFSADGLTVSGSGSSYFWENATTFDMGPAPSVIGAIKFTTPNQAWNCSYTLYRITK